jgi:hypothetical protein
VYRTPLASFLADAGTPVAHLHSVNIFDAIIIYLACGAPFGVYYFLHNRDKRDGSHLTLKVLLEWVIWPASAVKMIGGSQLLSGSKPNFDPLTELDAGKEEKVCEIQKSLEQIFFEGLASARISIYAFREVFDRYAGLSIALRRSGDRSSGVPQAEIFRAVDHGNVELASICLNRRNRSLLVAHQIQAREDFIDTLDRLAESPSERTDTWILVNELAVVLDDIEVIGVIDKIFIGTPQTRRAGRVKERGEVLWKPGKLKQLPTDQSALNLRPLPATMKLAKED